MNTDDARLPSGLEGMASAINHATPASCRLSGGNIGKWGPRESGTLNIVQRFWCNFLRQLNAIWQEKRWVSKHRGFSDDLPKKFFLHHYYPPAFGWCQSQLVPFRAAQVHLSHFSKPHLGRPRIVWQWKREEISVLYLNENMGMRFLPLKLDTRFLTCQGAVEELEGHTLNSPTVIYAFVYETARMPGWLFLGSKAWNCGPFQK